MKQTIEFFTDVMGRYSECVERNIEDIGEYVAEITECIIKYGKLLFVGLLIVISYIFLAATMPIWYLPYKYYKRKKKA